MERSRLRESLIHFYDKNCKKLAIIPIALLVLALVQITVQTARTGDFINRGISLKGGITITVPDANVSLENVLKSTFPKNEINVRSVATSGAQSGVAVEADFAVGDQSSVDKVLQVIGQYTGKEITNHSEESIGSSLSGSFFREVVFALLLAFAFMSIVVVITFRTFVPCFAVILCAFADIVVTMAAVNLTGMRLGTGAIAAYLMLIGYSVDTDILLTTKVVKQKEGTVPERVRKGMLTGLMMTFTTIAAVIVGLALSRSDVVRQIMTIILIGCCFDILNTWIQNAAILRWYMERKERHKAESV
jgi:preprotein translocase subunit SecF